MKTQAQSPTSKAAIVYCGQRTPAVFEKPTEAGFKEWMRLSVPPPEGGGKQQPERESASRSQLASMCPPVPASLFLLLLEWARPLARVLIYPLEFTWVRLSLLATRFSGWWAGLRSTLQPASAGLRGNCWASAPFVLLALMFLTSCEKSENMRVTEAVQVPAIEQTTEKGPVKLLVRITPKTPRLSDTLDLTLRIEAEDGVEIIPPPFGDSIGEFLVRDYTEKPVSPQPGKTAREFYYRLEPAHAGTHLIRSISAEFIDRRPGSTNKETRVLIESEPIEIAITSDLGDATPSLTNLAPMHAPLEPPSRLAFWVSAIAGGIAGGVAAYFVARRLRRKGPAPVKAVQRSPEELAREALEKLLRENLHGRGLYKEFYVRLTGVVRTYIEATTGLRAPEQTTEEFLRDMKRKNVFPVERSLQLAEFLEAADLVKYAGQEPGPRQIQDAIARAQEFIGLPSALSGMPQEVSVAAT